jgi:heat shock protein HslJ
MPHSLLAAALTALAGCNGGEAGAAGDAGPEQVTRGSLSGEWRLVSFGPEEGGAAPLEGTEISLVLAEEGAVAGSDGCNRYMGQYTLQGDDALSFGPLAGTLMACPEPIPSILPTVLILPVRTQRQARL